MTLQETLKQREDELAQAHLRERQYHDAGLRIEGAIAELRRLVKEAPPEPTAGVSLDAEQSDG